MVQARPRPHLGKGARANDRCDAASSTSRTAGGSEDTLAHFPAKNAHQQLNWEP